MTKRLYYASHDLSVHARVIAIGRDEQGNWVVPDQTLAHVKGGGQKADRGTIGGIRFTDVVSTEGRNGPARHYVIDEPTFCIDDMVEINVDPKWRRDNAASHNAGHVIAAGSEELCPGLKAVAAHHHLGESRVEFIGEIPADLNDFAMKLHAALKDLIRRDLAINVVGDPFEDRAIQIGNYTPVPCGGTHPTSTGQLGAIEIRGVKSKGGKLRVGYEVVLPDAAGGTT